MSIFDFHNRLLSNNHNPDSIIRPTLHFLCMLIIIVVVGPTIACDGLKKHSVYDNFEGMDMKLPSDTIIKHDKKNDTVFYLKGKNLSEGLEKDKNFQKLQLKNQFSNIALAFLTANRLFLKLLDPPNELVVKLVITDELGFKHVRFQQVFKGIPVWASEINVHLDGANHVYLVEGRYIPSPVKIDIHPVLNKNEAERIVVEKLGDAVSKHYACRSEIIIFADTHVEPCLAYRIVATSGMTEGWKVIVDATTGAVLKKLPTVYNGTNSH